MEEFAEAVRTGASGGKVAAPVFDRPTQLTQETIALRTRRRSTALVGASVALAALVGIGGWFALSGGSGPETATDVPPAVASAEPTDLAAGPAADTTVTVEAPPPASEGQPPSSPARDPEPTPTRAAPVSVPAEPAAVEQNGFLTVGTTPWGLVAIDGVEIRNSPLVSHQISIGEHVVTVTRMGYQTVVDTVVITAGNHTRIQHVLLPDTTAFRR